MKNIIVSLLLVCGVFSVDADEVKSVSVMEGESLTLHTDLTNIQRGDVIRWRFGEGNFKGVLVKIVKKIITYNYTFNDRLQVDSQTGDLTITNMRIKHSGLYEAEINRDDTTYKRFRVNVTESSRVIGAGEGEVKSVSVTEGESVTLHTDVQTHTDDLILWRFGDEGVLIAKDDKEDNKNSIYDDERFRDRLKLDDQTGSLTITRFRITDSGLYQLKISRNSKQTLCKTFSVSLRGQTDITTASKERVVSSGHVVGIVFGVLLAAAVVGVISYRRINYELQKRKVKLMTVLENRRSVTLHTGFTKLQSDDVIQWSFRDKVIYTFKDNVISSEEERFIDRLRLDPQTGSLIIRNIRTEDAGLYKVNLSSSSKVKLFLQRIISRGPSFSQFNVIVKVSKVENGSVTLHTGVTDLQSYDEIQWRFRETLIAQINIKNNTISTHDDVLEGIFRDKLKLDDQTGSLTITDLETEHTGEYKLRACGSSTFDDLQVKVFVRERMESAKLGDSVTLNTGVTEIQTDDEIQWRFRDEETLIAQITVGSEPSCDSTDERFRNKLELNPQTGDLTITNITPELTGDYRAKIISRRRETQYRKYKVVIHVFAYMRESVTLHTDCEIQRGIKIQWISGDKTILVTGKNGDDNKTKYTDDERFTDRLEMNPETGDLTITDIREIDMGLYTLQLIKSNGKIPYRIFQVWVWGDPSRILNKQKSEETNGEETARSHLNIAEAAV